MGHLQVLFAIGKLELEYLLYIRGFYTTGAKTGKGGMEEGSRREKGGKGKGGRKEVVKIVKGVGKPTNFRSRGCCVCCG